MLDRRRFTQSLVVGMSLPVLSSAPWRLASAATAGRTALYVAVGPDLTLYDTGADGTAAVPRGTVTVPAPIQYVWKHPSKPFVFVASSNRFSSTTNDKHHVTTFRQDPVTGALTASGEPASLKARPINITVDAVGRFLLVAYNDPSHLGVHPIGEDGAVGAEIVQDGRVDAGVYAHQVRVLPSNRAAVVIARGNDPASGKPEDPGAIKLFTLTDGRLAAAQTVAPGNGYGFGPRHVDFHPSQPWMYAAIERQNSLQMYRIDNDRLSDAPVYTKTTLADPANTLPSQAAGAIHVHPGGGFLYLSNRADRRVDADGQKVFAGGENSIAVFALDPKTGEPTLVQSAPTRSFHVRTFTVDPAGKTLVAASVAPMAVKDGGGVSMVPATLSMFRIGDDGRLTLAATHAVDTAKGPMFWCGFLPLG